MIVDIILGSEQSSRRLGKVAFGSPSSSDADAARSAAIASFLSAFAIVASLSDPTSLVGRHYWSRHDDLLSSSCTPEQLLLSNQRNDKDQFNAMRFFGRCATYKSACFPRTPLVVDSSKGGLAGSSAEAVEI